MIQFRVLQFVVAVQRFTLNDDSGPISWGNSTVNNTAPSPSSRSRRTTERPRGLPATGRWTLFRAVPGEAFSAAPPGWLDPPLDGQASQHTPCGYKGGWRGAPPLRSPSSLALVRAGIAGDRIAAMADRRRTGRRRERGRGSGGGPPSSSAPTPARKPGRSQGGMRTSSAPSLDRVDLPSPGVFLEC